MDSDEETRRLLLSAAGRQLAASLDVDVSTRAVCEAVGVTQPVLYRLFGSKEGLLDALADDGFERYTAHKDDQPVTDDPVEDLLSGWDDHLAFAAQNAALYQLMFVPRSTAGSQGRRRIRESLEKTLLRCAAAGRLRLEPRPAAQMILAANIGVAINTTTQGELYDDPTMPERVKDAVFAAVLRDRPMHDDAPTLRHAAGQLHAQLSLADTPSLAAPERALLLHWLDILHGPGPDRS